MFHLFATVFSMYMMANVMADEMMTLPIGLLIESAEPYASECDPKPELEHMEELFLNKEDAQQTTKCLRHCLMAQVELFKDGDTDVDSEKLVGFLALLYPEKTDELKEIVDDCNQRNKEMGLNEMCEVAHSFGMCMLKEMQSREYEIPIIEQ